MVYAKGEIIVIVDADTIIGRNALKEIVKGFEINEHVTDATGELTNIIAGSTKGILNETMGIDFKLSIPTTIMGSGHVLGYPSGSSIVIIPFVIDDSRFYLEVCLKE